MLPGGFTTNQAVLDITEELQNVAAVGLTHPQPSTTSYELLCTDHEEDCMLVCIDCLTGLCLKCLKQTSHHGHRLEELSEAKTVLQQRFSEQIIERLSMLESKISKIKESPYSVEEVMKAQVDIGRFREIIVRDINKWEDDQLKLMEDLKREAADQEKEIEIEQDLFQQQDIDIRTLITKLKTVRSAFQKPTC